MFIYFKLNNILQQVECRSRYKNPVLLCQMLREWQYCKKNKCHSSYGSVAQTLGAISVSPVLPLPPVSPTHLVISSKAASGKASISTSRDRISKSRVWGFGGAVRTFCSGDMGWWLPLPFASPGCTPPYPPVLTALVHPCSPTEQKKRLVSVITAKKSLKPT